MTEEETVGKELTQEWMLMRKASTGSDLKTNVLFVCAITSHPSVRVWNDTRSSVILGRSGNQMRKENVHQPLSINRTGLSLRCRNVLTLRQTSGKGKKKKSVYHTAQRSEAENIWDCSLWHVCRSCNCATIASPSPLLIYYLFTSSIKQQCVWCEIIISCCLFYSNRLYWNT